MKKLPDPLTKQEEAELEELRKKIFGGQMFAILTEEQVNTPGVKRYDFLLSKKMTYMAMQLQAKRMALLN